MMNNIGNIVQMLQQFKANPAQMIMQRRMNVPQNMMGDPNAIINHLLKTGQVTQEQLNSAYQLAQRFGR